MGFIDDLKHMASDINGALDKSVNNIGVGPQGISKDQYIGEYKQPVNMNNPDGLAGLGAVNASRDSVIDLASTVEAGATGPRAMFTPDMVFDSNGQLVHRNSLQQGQYPGQGQVQQGQVQQGQVQQGQQQTDFGYEQPVQSHGQQQQGQNDFGYGQPCYPGQNMGQDMNNLGQIGVNLNKDNQ